MYDCLMNMISIFMHHDINLYICLLWPFLSIILPSAVTLLWGRRTSVTQRVKSGHKYKNLYQITTILCTPNMRLLVYYSTIKTFIRCNAVLWLFQCYISLPPDRHDPQHAAVILIALPPSSTSMSSQVHSSELIKLTAILR